MVAKSGRVHQQGTMGRRLAGQTRRGGLAVAWQRGTTRGNAVGQISVLKVWDQGVAVGWKSICFGVA